MGGRLKIAVLAVALALAMAVPAASASAQASAPAATCGPGGPPYVNGKCISGNWAGLLAIGQGPYTAVIAYWKQPATSALVPLLYAATSIWVGLGGGASGDPVPVQVGTLMTTGPDAVKDCALPPCYEAVYETPDTNKAVPISNFTVHSGDEMAATVVVNDGDYSLTLDDMTTGQIWSSPDIFGNWPLNTAEIVVELPSDSTSILPDTYGLAPFKSVQFTNIYIGGVYALQLVDPNDGRTLVSESLPSTIATYHYSN
jgi:Peptidase A4 family